MCVCVRERKGCVCEREEEMKEEMCVCVRERKGCVCV